MSDILTGYKYVRLDADKDTSHINESNTLRKISEIASKFYYLEQENIRLKQENEDLKSKLDIKEGYEPEVFTCYTKTIPCRVRYMKLKDAKNTSGCLIPYHVTMNDEYNGFHIEVSNVTGEFCMRLGIWLTKEDLIKFFNNIPTII